MIISFLIAILWINVPVSHEKEITIKFMFAEDGVDATMLFYEV